MVDQLSLAVIEIEQQVAHGPHPHHFHPLLIADEIETEGGGGRSHGADAEQGHIEAFRPPEQIAQPAAFDQRLAGRR